MLSLLAGSAADGSIDTGGGPGFGAGMDGWEVTAVRGCCSGTAAAVEAFGIICIRFEFDEGADDGAAGLACGLAAAGCSCASW